MSRRTSLFPELLLCYFRRSSVRTPGLLVHRPELSLSSSSPPRPLYFPCRAVLPECQYRRRRCRFLRRRGCSRCLAVLLGLRFRFRLCRSHDETILVSPLQRYEHDLLLILGSIRRVCMFGTRICQRLPSSRPRPAPPARLFSSADPDRGPERAFWSPRHLSAASQAAPRVPSTRLAPVTRALRTQQPLRGVSGAAPSRPGSCRPSPRAFPRPG